MGGGCRSLFQTLQHSLLVWGAGRDPANCSLAKWGRLTAPTSNLLGPGGAGREDQDYPAPPPFSAHCPSGCSPLCLTPRCHRAVQGQTISPLHGFPLEPLHILARHRSILRPVHSQVQLRHQPLSLVREMKPGGESESPSSCGTLPPALSALSRAAAPTCGCPW